MEKISVEEKQLIYLQRYLYVIFDKYLGIPKALGKAMGLALKRTLLDVYPDRPGANGAVKRIRAEWACLFVEGLQESFRECECLSTKEII